MAHAAEIIVDDGISIDADGGARIGLAFFAIGRGRRGTVMRVAVLRDPPRAAVSPARDGIGSGSAAGRADLGAVGFQHASWDAAGRHVTSSAVAQHELPHCMVSNIWNYRQQTAAAASSFASELLEPPARAWPSPRGVPKPRSGSLARSYRTADRRL